MAPLALPLELLNCERVKFISKLFNHLPSPINYLGHTSAPVAAEYETEVGLLEIPSAVDVAGSDPFYLGVCLSWLAIANCE